MRQVVLDTETTGLEVSQDHRIIEIGCVEVRNRRRTGAELHHFLNPERDIEDGAFDVHGIRREDLEHKPRFADIAQELIEFVRDSEVIIHNSKFDEGFIDAELARLGPTWGRLRDYCEIVDSLKLARQLHPGQKNSLDALCNRYQIDNSARELHGALLDARILLDVYLAMTGGQASLLPDEGGASGAFEETPGPPVINRGAPLRTIVPTPAELAAHQRLLDSIDALSGGRCLWRKSNEDERSPD